MGDCHQDWRKGRLARSCFGGSQCALVRVLRMGVLLICIYRLVDIQLEDPTVIPSFRTFLFILEMKTFLSSPVFIYQRRNGVNRASESDFTSIASQLAAF